MSEDNALTGYLEDCCWTWIRDQCKGGACACRCHTDYPNRLAKHQYSGALEAVTELSAALAAESQRAERAEQRERELVAALESARSTMIFSPRDWGGWDKRDAWLYGILVGWDLDALAELAERFQWSEFDVQRLRGYSDLIGAVLARAGGDARDGKGVSRE